MLLLEPAGGGRAWPGRGVLGDALFPAACPLCGARDAGAGLGCAEHAPAFVLPGPRCGRCARPLPPMLPDGASCRACRAAPPAFERVRVLADYGADPALRGWILAFKHGGRHDLARVLGAALATRLLDAEGAPAAHGGAAAPPAVLVPVPLHWRRRFERGYDQARLLADAIGAAAGLRVVRALRRTRATPTQGAPLAPPRADNVRRAFAPAWGLARGRRGGRGRLAALAHRIAQARGAVVHDRRVWLVDDVLTSGATADACARVLLELGARAVGVLALARARGPRTAGGDEEGGAAAGPAADMGHAGDAAADTDRRLGAGERGPATLDSCDPA